LGIDFLLTKYNSQLDKYDKIFHEVILNSPIAIEIFDSDGSLIDANSVCLNLFGVSDFSCMESLNLFRDLNVPKNKQLKLKGHKGIKYETTINFDHIRNLDTSKKGTLSLNVFVTPLFSERDDLLNYMVQFQDITNYKKSEETFKELFNHMSSGLAVYEAIDDGNDFIFKEFNLAGEKIDQIKRKDVIGKNLLSIFPSVKEFGLFDVLKRVWKTGKPEHHPLTLYKDNRLEGWRENYIYKLSTGEIVAVYDDITERMKSLQQIKNSEESLRKLNEELKYKIEQRMKELRESEEKYRNAYEQANFYRELFAHDIKNILTVINSSSEVYAHYLNGKVDLKDIKKVLKNIKNQVNRGAQLITNVEKLSKIDEIHGSFKKIEVLTFLNHAIENVKKAYPNRKLKYQIRPTGKKYFVKANEFLEDVFENILLNAIEYNENSVVEIIIKLSKYVKRDEKFIQIEFMDNGIGIEDKRKKIIFQRGKRELKGSKGMGLGLSLVEKIIESYDGRIWVEDKVKGDHSKGSNFILLIPEAF
jgi:signal transduction histidine kinase